MLYKLLLDENNYLTGFVHTETSEDTFALEPTTMDLSHLTCYKLVDGSLIFDEEKKEEIIRAREEEEHHEEAVETQTRNLAEMFVASGENSTDFMERIDAQVLYSALMTDTLIESEVEVDE